MPRASCRRRRGARSGPRCDGGEMACTTRPQQKRVGVTRHADNKERRASPTQVGDEPNTEQHGRASQTNNPTGPARQEERERPPADSLKVYVRRRRLFFRNARNATCLLQVEEAEQLGESELVRVRVHSGEVGPAPPTTRNHTQPFERTGCTPPIDENMISMLAAGTSSVTWAGAEFVAARKANHGDVECGSIDAWVCVSVLACSRRVREHATTSCAANVDWRDYDTQNDAVPACSVVDACAHGVCAALPAESKLADVGDGGGTEYLRDGLAALSKSYCVSAMRFVWASHARIRTCGTADLMFSCR